LKNNFPVIPVMQVRLLTCCMIVWLREMLNVTATKNKTFFVVLGVIFCL